MLGIPARRSIDEASINKCSKSSTISKRWQTPAPPSILHLPRPPRRIRKPKKCNPSVDRSSDRHCRAEEEAQAEEEAHRGKLEALFGQEREFARSVPIVLLHPNAIHSPRRGKVLSRHSASSRESEDAMHFFELESSEREGASCREAWGPQDWKFQAEVLRAECNLLRMEKEVAVRRWEQGCAEMHHALTMAHSLHSAVQTIITGRKKIVDEKNAQVVLQTTLQNQIESLQGKLEKLQKNSEFRESELKKCSNFDRQAMFLQRRLDKLRKRSKERSYSEDTAKALQQRLETLVRAVCSTTQWESDEEHSKAGYVEIDLDEEDDHEVLIEPRLRIQKPSNIKCSLDDSQNRLLDATLLKEKLDSLSMNMNERKEAAAKIQKEYRSMLSSSGNCSSRRVDAPGRVEQEGNQENKLCSERCKATIRKIAEQVQAETEQWFQVQEILHHVRKEMEDLQKSRDFWEDHALHSDAKIATLQTAMHHWREKASKYENKVSELQSEITRVRNEKEQIKHRHALEQSRWLDGSSRLAQGLVFSNSAKSSKTNATDFDNDNHEAVINGSSQRNSSSKIREIGVVHHTEDENWNEKENLKNRFAPVTKPRIPKSILNSHTTSNKNSLNKASKLRQAGTNQNSLSMQSECVAAQLSGKRCNRKARDLHSKENSLLHNRHPQRETPVKRCQVNKNMEVRGSGKSSSSSTRSPLMDIGNASPFRVRRTIFPVSTEESSDP